MSVCCSPPVGFLSQAVASTTVGAAATRDARLEVNGDGVALVEYRQRGGGERHVLVWGAINALAHPTDASSVQQAFQVDYSGGWKSRHDPRYWRRFKNVCGSLRRTGSAASRRCVQGPRRVVLGAADVAAQAADARLCRPGPRAQKENEVHVSHWSGALPLLEVYRDWTYGHTKQGFFGRLTYGDQPVYGTRSPSARIGDRWARNIYIDTFNSDYGKGWRHDTAITTHSRSGGFCYTFVAQRPPRATRARSRTGTGSGRSTASPSWDRA